MTIPGAILRLALALSLGAAALPGPARAAGFKHEKSVYTDDRDVPLDAPEGVACDGKGAFVVADTGNGRLLTFTWKDGALAGGAEVKLAELPSPVRVQIDSKGGVLALDRKSGRVVRVDAAGRFGGFVEAKGVAGAVRATAFALDAEDRVVLLDGGARVLVVDGAGAVARLVMLPRDGGVFVDLAVDAAGRIHAVDAVRARVWTLEPGGAAFQPLTPALRDRMSFPAALAADRGRLLLVDQNGNGVVVLGQDGSFQGRDLATGWSDGGLYYPAQLCVNALGDAFVADRGNNRVQVFALAR